MESVPSWDTWNVPWDVPAKNRSWFPWREDKIKLVSSEGSSWQHTPPLHSRAAGFNNFNNLCCIWMGNLGGTKFPLKSLVTLVLVNQSNWRRDSPSEMYILSKHNDCLELQVIIHTVDTGSGHLTGCEGLGGHYLTQPTLNNLNVPPTFRYQQPIDLVHFPFLIEAKRYKLILMAVVAH